MEKCFVKVRSRKDIMISLVVMILGLGLMILPNSAPINISGSLVMLIGLLFAFTLKSAYIDPVTGKIYSKKERYFSQSKHDQLMHAVTSPKYFCTNGENEGSTLRLDIYYNEEKVYIQLLEYIPYTYEPCTKIYEHDINTGSKFINS